MYKNFINIRHKTIHTYFYVEDIYKFRDSRNIDAFVVDIIFKCLLYKLDYLTIAILDDNGGSYYELNVRGFNNENWKKS